MLKGDLYKKAKRIANLSGFKLGKEIYSGTYYSSKEIRDIIFQGSYKNKPAVLKIYNDPRLTDEPLSQIIFNRINTSRLLIAPKIYKYKIISPHQGWFIMEKLPAGGKFFRQPVEDKAKFVGLYLEYRLNFPQKPIRALTLAEQLRADDFHIFRISRWLELATAKETEFRLKGKGSLLKPREFIPRFERSLKIIRKEFAKRKMVWCHGHFKPHELFKVPNKNLYYLIDFAHTKMYPEGYELAFIIWADWLISANWKLSYQKWKKGVDGWLEYLKPVAKKLKIKDFNNLMVASLTERIIGSILADICASERPRPEKEKRIKLLYNLLDDMIGK